MNGVFNQSHVIAKDGQRHDFSMMPEGIENVLARKDLADLFAFLALDKLPGDPTAKPIPGAPRPGALKR